LVAATSYDDVNVVKGNFYYYVATAVDSSGIESAYSNEAQVLVP
jgi:fibronectin type 3 domain-containing protein